ncbi:MAG: ribonuclease HII [Candidatus Omnitrophica bacterium]|nr:ribonuclease HII [Candidatus Omnitrophota bacterium]
MLTYEKSLKNCGYDLVIGVDEAGRGPLAGPVVAAAVLLKDFKFNNPVDDSKKLTAAAREKACLEIKNKSLYSITAVSHTKIDRVNILQATILAMKKSVAKLACRLKPEELKRAFVLIDGNMRIDLDIPCQCIIGGDGKSLSIAAASILAKVHRDAVMCHYDKVYPQYGFNRHKGYATRMHKKAIKKNGPAAIHRKSFLCQENV